MPEQRPGLQLLDDERPGRSTSSWTTTATTRLDNTKVITAVKPDTYSVTEAATTGWELTKIDCDGATGTVNLGQGTVTFTVPNNGDVTCTFTNTKLKNNPTITTAADQTGVVVGGTVSDSATLAGATAGAGGTITFRAYGPNDPNCGDTPAFTSSAVAVNGNGTYGPVSFATDAVGTFKWIASYSGDADNNPVAGKCGDDGETDTTHQGQPDDLDRASANDHDRRLGLRHGDPGRRVQPDRHDHLQAVRPERHDLHESVRVHDHQGRQRQRVVHVRGVQPRPSSGTYRWVASYGGDANNNAVSGACNDANESVVVSPATPGIATSAAESGRHRQCDP